MTYSDAIIKKDDFLTYLDIERNVAHNTYKSYQYDLNQFFRFWDSLNKRQEEDFDSRSKLDITGTLANPLVSIHEAVPKFFMHLYNLKVQKSSIGRKVACFQSFVKYLHRNNISINLKLTAPRINKKLPTYLTTDEITYMLDTMPDDFFTTKRPFRDRALLETLYATGVRCSELTNIKLSDINFDHKTILITGKGNKQRMVLFGNKAKVQILKYLQEEREKDLKDKNLEYLFICSNGTRLTDRALQLILQDLSKLLPFKKMITPHKLRHTFATHLLNAGMNLRALQELLGHSSLSTTERYTHVTTKDLKELYQNMNPMEFLKN